jgi:hypothetical protein
MSGLRGGFVFACVVVVIVHAKDGRVRGGEGLREVQYPPQLVTRHFYKVDQTMETYPKASIPATEIRTIKSRHVKQEYRISIALPYSYPSKPRKRYPVIFLLDANFFFGMVTELTRLMPLCERFPETIVVGIGYPVDEPLEDAFLQIAALRSRDFTPVVDKQAEKEDANVLKGYGVGTGGAQKFLKFIKTELIPIIQAEYRVSSTDRVLVGHSLGGLFTLYTLFHQPKLFKGYVAGSPSLWYKDRVIFKYENQFAKKHKTLPVRLFLNMGELEEGSGAQMLSNMIQFADRVESRKYKGLTLVRQISDKCDHCAATARTFQAGITAMFPGSKIKVSFLA